MNKFLLPSSSNFYKEECLKFVERLVNFSSSHCGVDTTKNVNRVDLKKGLLNVTKGRSLTNFIRTLSQVNKRHILNLTMMECPVICPTRKMLLPPIESMPSNIMKSSKKLRNFFGIPELQVCRSCIKRSRCRRYQEVERDVPDLSDLISMMIGLYTLSKLYISGNELIVPEFTLKDIRSANIILDTLNEYFNKHITEVEIPRGDDAECNRELRRLKRERELKKLDLLKTKVFNIPQDFNISPNGTVYMTRHQRELYNKLYKKKNKTEYIWVPDIGDTTLVDESKLSKIQFETPQIPLSSETPQTPEKIEDLEPHEVQFRMDYSTPIGTNYNITRYDIFNDKYLQGIKVNHKGRITIDLNHHNSQGHTLNASTDISHSIPGINLHQSIEPSHLTPEENSQGSNDTENLVDGAEGGSIRKRIDNAKLAPDLSQSTSVVMYNIVSSQKLNYYSDFIRETFIRQPRLSFLKTVPYNYKCQSSGEPRQNQTSDMDDLLDITEAIQAQQGNLKSYAKVK